ncbi:MAG: NAD(P)/FAD-dependent oxidoreductase [Clostridia bacterium]|nr:NAD(P)/FAD-dependent oxidoreductase [Clostridia bacterium]
MANSMDYDVIIVGAGNGGLTCANEIASNGYRVLLLDKHNLPGGVASSFVRGRFEYEASLHELCDLGTEEHPGKVKLLLDRLGVSEPFENEMTLFRTVVKGENGYDVSVKAGREDFVRSMLEICPESGKSLEKLLKLLDSTAKALEYNERTHGKPSKLVMLLKYSGFLISASHSLDDVLLSLGFEDKARSILETYWSYLGVPANEINAFHYLEMMFGYINGGAAVPRNRSYAISLALADRALDKGCEIRLDSEVTEFILDGDRICGVKIASGEEFRAREVVSNIIPHNVANMLPSDKVRDRDKKLLNARRFGISFLCIYIGLDVSAEELGMNYTTFISDSLFSDRNTLRRQFPDVYVVNCLNAVVDDATPPGTSTLFITVPVYPQYFMEDVTAGNYRAFKNAAAEHYIDDCERTLGVSIREHIEEISVTTPVTFARYFNAPEGTAYGYELSHWDGLMARMLDKINKFDFDGLTFCGGHGETGDGFGVTYLSGIEAAEKVVRSLRFKDRLTKIRNITRIARKDADKSAANVSGKPAADASGKPAAKASGKMKGA